MKYKDWAPTQFDTPGAFLDDDRDDWIVSPCMRTRDSGVLDESNFETLLKILGEESEKVEVHRFGHWGPGWFEIILCHPDLENEIEEIQRLLENYPVLDDEDYSQRETDKVADFWDNCSLRERVDICKRFNLSIFAARRPETAFDYSDIYEYLRS